MEILGIVEEPDLRPSPRLGAAWWRFRMHTALPHVDGRAMRARFA